MQSKLDLWKGKRLQYTHIEETKFWKQRHIITFASNTQDLFMNQWKDCLGPSGVWTKVSPECSVDGLIFSLLKSFINPLWAVSCIHFPNPTVCEWLSEWVKSTAAWNPFSQFTGDLGCRPPKYFQSLWSSATIAFRATLMPLLSSHLCFRLAVTHALRTCCFVSALCSTVEFFN